MEQLASSAKLPGLMPSSSQSSLPRYRESSTDRGIRTSGSKLNTTDLDKSRNKIPDSVQFRSRSLPRGRKSEQFNAEESLPTHASTLINFPNSGMIQRHNSNHELLGKTLRSNHSAQSEFQVHDFYLTNLLEKPGHASQTQNVSNQDLFKKEKPQVTEFMVSKLRNRKYFESLPPSLKEFFSDKREFLKIFEDYDVANVCLDEVLVKIKCYRVEIGMLLEKVIDTHRLIYEKTITSTMKLVQQMNTNLDNKMIEVKQTIEKLEKEKIALEQKSKNVLSLLNISESTSKMHLLSVEKLEEEMGVLQEILKRDFLNKGKAILEKKQEELVREALFQKHNPNKRQATEMLTDNLTDLQKMLDEFDKEHHKKTDIIKNMNNQLKATLQKIKYDATTQVDESELGWTARNLYDNDDAIPKDSDFYKVETSAVNIEGRILDRIKDRERYDGVETKDFLKVKEKQFAAQKKDLPPEKPTKRRVDEFEAVMENWSLPLCFIVFLENSAKINEQAKVLPWPYQAKIIFEIYKERNANSLEISHSLINTYVPLNEFVCIYFLKTYRLRRVAEMKMLEFLASLRYHAKSFLRAATFAQLCGIIPYVNKNIQNPMERDITHVYDFDVYLQNFFFFAFNTIISDPQKFVETEDVTLVPKEMFEEIINTVLVFENEAGKKKLQTTLERQTTRITVREIHEYIGIDIDKFLAGLIEVFIEAKKRNIKAITKSFTKQAQESDNVFSKEDFVGTFSEVNENGHTLRGYVYPKEFTMMRAFLSAITSGKNDNLLTLNSYLKSCSLFGLDCPFPFVNMTSDENTKRELENYMKMQQTRERRELERRRQTTKDLKFKPQQQQQQQQIVVQKPTSLVDESMPSLSKGISEMKQKKEEEPQAHGMRVDAVSTLFVQHFSILRELKTYCNQFKDLVKVEQDPQVLWKSFDQIADILKSGCQFLEFPVIG